MGLISLVRPEFEYYCQRWKEETKFISSTTQIIDNKHYKSIIAMGICAIPLIAEDMKNEPGLHWYYAIESILGDGPDVPDDMRGRMYELNELYLKWLEKNGLTEVDPAKLILSMWGKMNELKGHIHNLLNWAGAGEGASSEVCRHCDREVAAASEAVDRQ